MIIIPNHLYNPLLEILEWYPRSFYVDRISEERCWDLIALLKDGSKETTIEIEEGHAIDLKCAIETAMNYQKESGISQQDINMLWDWIWPIYTSTFKRQG